MPEVTIRNAVLADDAALAALDRRSWTPLHAVKPRPQPPYEPFFSDAQSVEKILVAELEGRPAGYLRLDRPTPLECNAHVRQIRGLVVDAWARGHGVARALLYAADERAVEQGARRLTLRVLGHNAPARRLYASVGYAVEGVLPGEFLLDGEYVDDVLMGKTVGAERGSAAVTP